MAMDSNQGGNWTGFSYIKFARTREDITPNETGGLCYIADAAAVVLNSGDVVYQSATGANKSATAANYVGLLGIVVGGKLTNMKIVYGTGQPCTTGVAGEDVIIQYSGIAKVVAGGIVTLGTNFAVVPDTGTAGRVIAGTTAGQIIGTVLSTGAAAGDMLIRIAHR